MGIYYYKLWEKLNAENLSQNELSRLTGISSATITKMRNGEYVAIEVLDRIRDLLCCDYGDLITSIPPQNRYHLNIKGATLIKVANDCFRTVLKRHMHENQITVKDISESTGISINTIKKFLSGENVEKRSLEKMMVLGEEISMSAINLIQKHIKENPTVTHICQREGTRNFCRAYRTVFIPETKSYEGYCPFGFKQIITDDDKVAAIEDCPFPTSMHELMEAKNKYNFKLRGNMIFIPAKDDKF